MILLSLETYNWRNQLTTVSNIRQCLLSIVQRKIFTVRDTTDRLPLPPLVYRCSWEEVFFMEARCYAACNCRSGPFTRVHKGSSVYIFSFAYSALSSPQKRQPLSDEWEEEEYFTIALWLHKHSISTRWEANKSRLYKCTHYTQVQPVLLFQRRLRYVAFQTSRHVLALFQQAGFLLLFSSLFFFYHHPPQLWSWNTGIIHEWSACREETPKCAWSVLKGANEWVTIISISRLCSRMTAAFRTYRNMCDVWIVCGRTSLQICSSSMLKSHFVILPGLNWFLWFQLFSGNKRPCLETAHHSTSYCTMAFPPTKGNWFA